MKQTAVEWLIEQYKKGLRFTEDESEIQKQAIEMEKEQLKKAYCDGNPQFDDCAEEYYNETYEKNKV